MLRSCGSPRLGLRGRREQEDDIGEVAQRGRYRRNEEAAEAVEHAHRERADGYEHKEGEHHARQRHRDGALLGREAGGHDVDEEGREYNPRRDDCAASENQYRQRLVGEALRAVAPVGGERARENGDERGRERPLGQELAREVRECVGDEKRVELARRAEERRGQHLAHKAEDAADERPRHHAHRVEYHAGERVGTLRLFRAVLNFFRALGRRVVFRLLAGFIVFYGIVAHSIKSHRNIYTRSTI